MPLWETTASSLPFHSILPRLVPSRPDHPFRQIMRESCFAVTRGRVVSCRDVPCNVQLGAAQSNGVMENTAAAITTRNFPNGSFGTSSHCHRYNWLLSLCRVHIYLWCKNRPDQARPIPFHSNKNASPLSEWVSERTSERCKRMCINIINCFFSRICPAFVPFLADPERTDIRGDRID